MYCNKLPFETVINNGEEVKVYGVDLNKYKLNKCSTINPNYVSLDGKKYGRIKTRPYAQYSGIVTRTSTAKSSLNQKPTYYGCTLDDRFNTFDKWVAWAENQIGFMCTDEDGNLYHLDKDILSYPEVNKHYSPDNCRFIPFKVNTGINGFKLSKHLETKRNFLNMVFDNYFETIDEDILDKIIDISGHNHDLDKFEVKTEETLKARNKYDIFLSKIVHWEDSVNLDNFIFNNGLYSYKKSCLSERATTSKEAILKRLKPKLSELKSMLTDFEQDKESVLGKWWRLDEVEMIIKSKVESHTKMISDIENGKIKTPHYILTYV